jgi:hypothetical protein
MHKYTCYDNTMNFCWYFMNDIKCINYDRPTDKVLKFTLLKIDEVQSCRLNTIGDHHGRDCMVVGFITTYAISTYHHSCCEFKSHLREVYSNTTLCDKVCQWLMAGWWFSLCTLDSSTNKTDHHNIAEILLKVVLNIINLNLKYNINACYPCCNFPFFEGNKTLLLIYFSTLKFNYQQPVARWKWIGDCQIPNWCLQLSQYTTVIPYILFQIITSKTHILLVGQYFEFH